MISILPKSVPISTTIKWKMKCLSFKKATSSNYSSLSSEHISKISYRSDILFRNQDFWHLLVYRQGRFVGAGDITWLVFTKGYLAERVLDPLLVGGGWGDTRVTLVCRALATLEQAVEMTSLFKAFQFIKFWSQITNNISELIGVSDIPGSAQKYSIGEN